MNRLKRLRKKKRLTLVKLSKSRNHKMTVWALFDSGNGSYTKGAKALDLNIDIYPIGIDIENKKQPFYQSESS